MRRLNTKAQVESTGKAIIDAGDGVELTIPLSMGSTEDTGVRNINAEIPNRLEGDFYIRRVGKIVYFTIQVGKVDTGTSSLYTSGKILPVGWIPAPRPTFVYASFSALATNYASSAARVSNTGEFAFYKVGGLLMAVTMSWITDDPFPTAPFGVPG